MLQQAWPLRHKPALVTVTASQQALRRLGEALPPEAGCGVLAGEEVAVRDGHLTLWLTCRCCFA